MNTVTFSAQSGIWRCSDSILRILIYLSAASTLAACMVTGLFNETILVVAATLILYPLAILFLNQLVWKKKPPAKLPSLLVCMDSIFLGIYAPLLGFSLVPCLTLWALVVMMAMLSGGLILCITSTFLLALSILATLLITPIQINLDTPMPVTLVNGSMTLITLFFFAASLRAKMLDMEKFHRESRLQDKRNSRIAQNLSKYLSSQVWDLIFMESTQAKLESKRKKLTIFFSDIKDFTRLSDELAPEELTELLNYYFTEMSRIALRHGGTVDKFVGDSIMIFFGDVDSQGCKMDAINAVSMSLEMRNVMKILRKHWKNMGIEKPLEIRMGINTGYCAVGNFGANHHMDYTIIGREVNLASRLESSAEPGEILISQETYSLVKNRINCRSKGEINVKGFSKSIPVYCAVNYKRHSCPDVALASLGEDPIPIYRGVPARQKQAGEEAFNTLNKTHQPLDYRTVN
jgi:class 3 adenylate cyclase